MCSGRTPPHPPHQHFLQNVPYNPPVARFVFYSTDPFDGVWRRRQHLSAALAGLGHEVTYLEPPLRLAQVLGKEPDTSLIRRPFSFRQTEGVHVTRSVHPVPWISKPWARNLNFRLDIPFLKRLLPRAEQQTNVLWLTNPLHGPLAKALGQHATVVADLTDRWSAFDCNRTWAAQLDQEQARLVQNAHRVCTVSEDLLAFAKQSDPAKPPLFLPNGVSERLFSPLAAPEWVQALRPPWALYAGTLEERVDFGLLLELAGEFSDITWVLVGPVATEHATLKALRALPNVVCTGAKPHAEVMAAMQHCTFTLLPHHQTPLTRSVGPRTLMEDRAAGKPCVATPVGGVKEAAELVLVVENPAQAKTAVRKILQGEDTGLKEKRMAFARQHTWANRAREITGWLGL